MSSCTGIEFADSDGQLLARCARAEVRRADDAEAVRAAVAAAGFGTWALDDDALAALLRRCATEDGEFEQAIGERRDACTAVELAPDGAQAWVDLTPARGGRPASVEDLVKALAAAGVVHGIRSEALERACSSPVPLRVVAAVATPPTPGEATRFELLVSDTRDRRPVVDEQGLVDFHELGQIPLVTPGQPLMRRHPPTPGVDGCDVLGTPIPAPAVADVPFDAVHPGSAAAEGDADLLCALNAGLPVRAEHSVSVEQLLRLDEVSLASGNIRFDGTVEVAGDVRPGMMVEASGDLIVKGLAEGAHLKAGGSIRVGGGLIAKSVAQAGQSFSARFTEHSSVVAGTTISIDDSAVHCELQALNDVRVGLKSRQRGRLVGGTTSAMMNVSVPTLGAAAGGVTKVQVGLNPVLDARQRELAALVERRKADEEKLGMVVRHLQLHGDPRGLLERAQATWQLALRELAEAMQELSEVESRLELAGNARVDVLGGIDGDVDLVFGLTWRRLRHRYGAGSFAVDADGRIIYANVSGKASEVD